MNIQHHYDQLELAKRTLAKANKVNRDHQRRAMRILNRKRAALRHAQNGTSPAKRYAPNFWATVRGINCGVAITYADRCPRGFLDIEFKLINEKGYHMEFLHKKASEEELLYIHRECEKIANYNGWG